MTLKSQPWMLCEAAAADTDSKLEPFFFFFLSFNQSGFSRAV